MFSVSWQRTRRRRTRFGRKISRRNFLRLFKPVFNAKFGTQYRERTLPSYLLTGKCASVVVDSIASPPPTRNMQPITQTAMKKASMLLCKSAIFNETRALWWIPFASVVLVPRFPPRTSQGRILSQRPGSRWSHVPSGGTRASNRRPLLQAAAGAPVRSHGHGTRNGLEEADFLRRALQFVDARGAIDPGREGTLPDSRRRCRESLALAWH